ncbi:hypothetical protein IE4872_PD00591 (plasmid) [Rhizobium gallicum]|uniref:Uncharacterized protein n=1 Tax=Rhizobium gallicum TaxID=56730 RepID=A0A1L5NTB8_9HYPH|nr:hypothetical protein IE4872_PD00591 [Rhizobium gallicum]
MLLTIRASEAGRQPFKAAETWFQNCALLLHDLRTFDEPRQSRSKPTRRRWRFARAIVHHIY